MTDGHAALVVIAKAPVAGRSKTRLCPPCTPDEAATLAEAALADTLAAVASVPERRRVLVLDGRPGRWLPPGFEVIPQRNGGLDHRLAGAFDDVGGPALLVGMDTPQLTPTLLAFALDRLEGEAVDAVLGPALDGGYWAVGLRQPRADAFVGVPMSTAATGENQVTRLTSLGLTVVSLPALRDVDHFDDALAVADEAPGSRFATAVRAMTAVGAELVGDA
ncbi:MAG TPA: TIGR04282 family arsenosugar biosynthesis glycosyltransferase [Acidimicrobiia bacterium]|nr:TIGR04282 family arsenosugar biosynthesis glycosyltransferase [Acidimicrobiia bacterium]